MYVVIALLFIILWLLLQIFSGINQIIIKFNGDIWGVELRRTTKSQADDARNVFSYISWTSERINQLIGSVTSEMT